METRVIVFLVSVAGAWRAPEGRSRDVWTSQGRARGYFSPDPPHYAYLGLPYAATRSRFKAPEPPPQWDGIFEATHRVKCHQPGAGDENCLVVNVFTPELEERMPVLVIVHGGDFQTGWGSHKPPSKLISQGLVIVTFNYRLGSLGFLCLKIPEASGNAGLKDQVAALYWVQRNIANFGGDSSDVTVYGTGSGAAAIQILLLSGLSKGLFHKAILESGSVLSPISLSYEPVRTAFNVAQKLGYKYTQNPDKLAKFFKSVPLRQLTNLSVIFLPCVERSYYYMHGLLDEDPMDVLKGGTYDDVPLLLVYTHTDGMLIVEKNTENLNSVPEEFDKLLPNNLLFDDEQKRLRIAELVKNSYFDVIENTLTQNYADYFHDVLYEFPIIKFGVLYAAKSSHPVYLMNFNYKSRLQRDIPIKDTVIDYFYNNAIKDELVVSRLTTLLCNFIKLGDPTPITTSLVPVIWKAIGEGSLEPPQVKTAPVLHFQGSLSMSTTRKTQRLSFWDHIYNNFYRSHSTEEEETDS